MSIVKQPPYTRVNQLSENVGGTLSGAVHIDTVEVLVAGATAQQSSVGSKPFDQRGVSVGTYYWVFNNFSNGTATGTFHTWWAEATSLVN